MIKYKVVPVGPTPEMVAAAEDAHMPFGDMDIALRCAILAAPDTGMVAVPRELLERIVNTNMADYAVIVYQHKEIRTIMEKAND